MTISDDKTVHIETLMEVSGVKFGTSGARGLVREMTDRVCVAYTLAFLEHLRDAGLSSEAKVVVGGDLRPSTPRIMRAVIFAASHLGHAVEFAGWVPSPAVALRGFKLKAPSIMVTGSHIPDDRNGIKFNTTVGEATKDDEVGVRARRVTVPDVFDDQGMFLPGKAPELGPPSREAAAAYQDRYLSAFPTACLKGLRLGVYGHSAVGRDLMVELYEALGAEVLRLGFSETFIPVDTEAIRQVDVDLALEFAREHQLDAIVSTDGDSDRPLISDEQGLWFRGDIAGILVAQYLGADAVVTPVSSNTAVEAAGFSRVIRTRIGSPHVIAGMEDARAASARAVVGYEANGGFLSLSSLKVPGGGVLEPLPTRDAVVVHLALLLRSRDEKVPLSRLSEGLLPRFTSSDRDQNFSQDRSLDLLTALRALPPERQEKFFKLGPIVKTDDTDGHRLTFSSGEIVHLRPSGNAPELRCYAEASSSERSAELVRWGLSVAYSITC